MKSYAIVLQELNDGMVNSGATADLAELLRTVQHTGRGGTLTLKLKVASASKGAVEVDKITITVDRKLELPKPDSPSDFFWLTDEAEPTRNHPRQHALDLRDAGEPTPVTLKDVQA